MKKSLLTVLLLTTVLLLAACSLSFDLFGEEPTPAPTDPPPQQKRLCSPVTCK